MVKEKINSGIISKTRNHFKWFVIAKQKYIFFK